MKKFALLLSLLLLMGLLWKLIPREEASLPPSATPSKASTTSPSSAIEPQPRASTEETPSPEFQIWVNQEGDRIEESTQDPEAKEKELRAWALQLKPHELHYLEKQSLQAENSARRRIFSTYLLTLVPENAKMNLLAILEAPMSYPDQNPAHSPEETLATQERALRRMALEALLARAQNDLGARSELKLFISKIRDENLRNYAEQALAKMR